MAHPWEKMDLSRSVCIPKEAYELIQEQVPSLARSTLAPSNPPVGPGLAVLGHRLKYMAIGGAVAIVLAFLLWGRR